MSGRDRYVALVASLPNSERLFFAKRPPLSRLRLERRLRGLTEGDAAALAVIEDVMSWRAYGMSVSAPEAIARAKRALERIEQPTLSGLMRERLEMRAGVAALRLRARGVEAAAVGPALGPWGARFVRNWPDPLFNAGRRHPWLAKASTLIAERDPVGLERHILDTTFRQLQRWGGAHQFDFEAVVIYVLKWSIFDRWSRANAEGARRRFDALAALALSDFPELRVNGDADGGL